MHRLTTPLDEGVLDLTAGDRLTLSGTIYTARDEAHLRMIEEGIPFDPVGAVVYHCGPVIHDGQVVAAGPTTSARMNQLGSFLIEAGVRAFIGKGGMGGPARDALHDRAVYFAFTGGCAALASARMKLAGVYFEDLGMAEAVWVIQLTDLPVIVGIDAHGGDIYRTVTESAEKRYTERYGSISCGHE